MQIFQRLKAAAAAVGTKARAAIFRVVSAHLPVRVGTEYVFECYGPDGVLKWRDTGHNLVVNEGLDDLLDKYFKGSTYTAAHYVGLTDGTPTIAAGDTMGSHTGWTEVTAYSETNRQDFTPGTVSGQSVDNSGSKATVSINSDGTVVGGAFLTTDNTKGGTTGTLYGAVALDGGDKTVDSGDTLNITATATASSS